MLSFVHAASSVFSAGPREEQEQEYWILHESMFAWLSGATGARSWERLRATKQQARHFPVESAIGKKHIRGLTDQTDNQTTEVIEPVSPDLQRLNSKTLMFANIYSSSVAVLQYSEKMWTHTVTFHIHIHLHLMWKKHIDPRLPSLAAALLCSLSENVVSGTVYWRPPPLERSSVLIGQPQYGDLDSVQHILLAILHYKNDKKQNDKIGRNKIKSRICPLLLVKGNTAYVTLQSGS